MAVYPGSRVQEATNHKDGKLFMISDKALLWFVLSIIGLLHCNCPCLVFARHYFNAAGIKVFPKGKKYQRNKSF